MTAPTTVRSVYVHAPFCVRRCVYCDFAVQVRRVGGSLEWLEALAGEVRVVEAEGTFLVADALETLYVGGGTPSLLGADAMAGLARVLGPHRVSAPELEWTSEANPESFTPDVAAGWREAGVNRISFGVQSFDPEALRWMGRLHGPEGAHEAVRRARLEGFDNVSIDLIFGLPPRLGRSWRSDLERAVDLGVDHVSLYGLTVEEATPLGRAVREGRETGVDEEQYREEFLLAAELLGDAGFEHYEVSNFARPGKASRHNGVYWDGRPYLGLGNAAHSYAHPLRRWNVREWEAYYRKVTSGELPEAGRETVGHDEARMERIWLALRTAMGLPVADLGERALDHARGWEAVGLAVVDERAVRLTTEGWLLLDRLALELDRLAAA